MAMRASSEDEVQDDEKTLRNSTTGNAAAAAAIVATDACTSLESLDFGTFMLPPLEASTTTTTMTNKTSSAVHDNNNDYPLWRVNILERKRANNSITSPSLTQFSSATKDLAYMNTSL